MPYAALNVPAQGPSRRRCAFALRLECRTPDADPSTRTQACDDRTDYNRHARGGSRTARAPERGFTLIEVLIALAIVAVALGAVMCAIGAGRARAVGSRVRSSASRRRPICCSRCACACGSRRILMPPPRAGVGGAHAVTHGAVPGSGAIS
ncbi:type II secretion system protein [Burkholderia contaminans]|uniref:type II secretion system protein n=1 Tax=Burkholderia contaminans TaxID=488447 RepID=UPI003F68AB78